MFNAIFRYTPTKQSSTIVGDGIVRRVGLSFFGKVRFWVAHY